MSNHQSMASVLKDTIGSAQGGFVSSDDDDEYQS